MTYSVKKLEKADEATVRVLQISDAHLYADVNGTLLGLNTEASLSAVMQDVKSRKLVSDMVLLTGDMSQDASAEAYLRLIRHVDALHTPAFWLPGNHDNFERMSDILESDFVHPHKQVLVGHWNIILLNSQVPKKVYGRLSEAELQFLRQALSAYPEHHSLIVLHHHPVAMQCEWIDNIGVKNADEFWSLLSAHKNVKGVLWGHVHQELDTVHEGVVCMSTPSTCIQFKPYSEDFAADTVGPGYRVLDLMPDGAIETAVFRVVDASLKVDYSIKGY